MEDSGRVLRLRLRRRAPTRGPAKSHAVTLALATALVLAALTALPARAVAPPSPWDGSNPFNCTIQHAGFGPTGPDPGADPYCVRFNKTHQNVTQFGVVDFLLKEPARTAAASPKCFYFQEDHWRGSVVQSDGRTLIYEFEGHYFFNKATGDGGGWVTNFTLAGQSFDPTAVPGFPPAYGGYFSRGTGGFITHNEVPADPQCAARAAQNPAAIYAAHSSHCVPNNGRLERRRLGPVTLGETEDRVRAELGSPRGVKRGFLRYCAERHGMLLIGERGDRSGTFGSGGRAPAVLLLTTAKGFILQARHHRVVRVGSPARSIRRAVPGAAALGRVRGIELVRRHGLIFGLAHRRVAYLGVYSRRKIRTTALLKSFLRRA